MAATDADRKRFVDTGNRTGTGTRYGLAEGDTRKLRIDYRRNAALGPAGAELYDIHGAMNARWLCGELAKRVAVGYDLRADFGFTEVRFTFPSDDLGERVLACRL